MDSAESADEPGWPYSILYRHRSYQARREKAKQRIKIPFSQLFLSLWLERGARERSIELPSGESFILTVESGIHKEEMKMGLPTEGVTN